MPRELYGDKARRHKRWVELNRERKKRLDAIYYKALMANPQKRAQILAKRAEWYAKNGKVYSREYFRKRYATDEKFRERTKKNVRVYIQNNPEQRQKVYIRNHQYRARRRGANGVFSYSDWTDMIKRTGGRCTYCGSEKKLTVDHIVPLSKGGTNYRDNLQLLCRSCNARKSDKLIQDFICVVQM